jgi:hypothetical protein
LPNIRDRDPMAAHIYDRFDVTVECHKRILEQRRSHIIYQPISRIKQVSSVMRRHPAKVPGES